VSTAARPLTVVALGLTAGGVATAQNAKSTAEAEVREAELQWSAATDNTDVAAQERLMTDGFTYINVDANVTTRFSVDLGPISSMYSRF
jgi:hypothetical protein